MSFGVPLGATMAFQALKMKSTPASLVVGTSGRLSSRVGRRDGIGLDGPALDLRDDVQRLVDHVVDLAADEVVERRARCRDRRRAPA